VFGYCVKHSKRRSVKAIERDKVKKKSYHCEYLCLICGWKVSWSECKGRGWGKLNKLKRLIRDHIISVHGNHENYDTQYVVEGGIMTKKKESLRDQTKKHIIKLLKSGFISKDIATDLSGWTEPRVRAIKAHITMGRY